MSNYIYEPGKVLKLMPDRKRKHPKRKPLADKGIKQLNKKQRGALHNFMNNGMTDKKTALVKAGYCESVNPRVMDKLVSRKPIIAWLEKKKVGDEKLATVIAEGLDAMNVKFRDYPDHNVRHKFVAEVNRIVGNYAPTKIQAEQRVFNITLTGEDVKMIQKYFDLTREPDDKH